jgi:hypothetical protein
MYMDLDSDATADWLGLHPGPRTETLCPENIEFLKGALEDCTADCHPPATAVFFPTRLLDLGTDATSHPRLIITADSIRLGELSPVEPIRYAAVSYCWGDEADAATQTKTEPSNLQERLRGIPTRDMSAVLQDSITVCRALSVRYLWIDAVCIIQDPADTSDWEEESERVGQVYQHAYFTICAVSTGSCHESFLARSRHTFDLDFRSSLYPAAAQGGYALEFTGLSNWSTLDYDPLAIDLLDSPWNLRGWVFQERELSARKLLFGRHMVHFECGERQESENMELDWLAGPGRSAPALPGYGFGVCLAAALVRVGPAAGPGGAGEARV